MLRRLLSYLTSKRFLKRFVIVFIMLSLIVIICNWRVNFFAQEYVYDNVDSIPYNKVGLVLGTAKYLKGGYTNPYFEYRINAAVELYRAEKIDFIIVSGDNATMSYNEPKLMKESLVKHGIPASSIVLDYAGFRTLDSVVRAKEVFGQSSITVISQKFHTERAIFIAHKKGIRAVGYNARDVSKKQGARTNFRELLARVKLMIDLYILRTEPKFLGDEITID